MRHGLHSVNRLMMYLENCTKIPAWQLLWNLLRYLNGCSSWVCYTLSYVSFHAVSLYCLLFYSSAHLLQRFQMSVHIGCYEGIGYYLGLNFGFCHADPVPYNLLELPYSSVHFITERSSYGSTVLGIIFSVCSPARRARLSVCHMCAQWQNERTYCRYLDTDFHSCRKHFKTSLNDCELRVTCAELQNLRIAFMGFPIIDGYIPDLKPFVL